MESQRNAVAGADKQCGSVPPGDRGPEAEGATASPARVPERYLLRGGLATQTPTAIWPYRAEEAVRVDANGRPWLNLHAQPYVAVALGDRSLPWRPVVHIELTGDGRRVLILSEGWMIVGSEGSEECYKWPISEEIPSGWHPADEVREVN